MKKKRIQNKLLDKQIISFRSNLSPEAKKKIRDMKKIKKSSEFINQAIERSVFLENNKKEFLIQIIIPNFNLVKFLVRKIGNEIKQKKEK